MATNLFTPAHLAVILVVLMLIFGAKRLPETGRALGRGMREFKEAITVRDSALLTGSDTDTTPTQGETS